METIWIFRSLTHLPQFISEGRGTAKALSNSTGFTFALANLAVSTAMDWYVSDLSDSYTTLGKAVHSCLQTEGPAQIRLLQTSLPQFCCTVLWGSAFPSLLQLFIFPFFFIFLSSKQIKIHTVFGFSRKKNKQKKKSTTLHIKVRANFSWLLLLFFPHFVCLHVWEHTHLYLSAVFLQTVFGMSYGRWIDHPHDCSL